MILPVIIGVSSDLSIQVPVGLSLAVLFFPSVGTASDLNISVPPVANGNAASTGPFSSFTPQRHQEVYDSYAFAAIASGGGWISQIGSPARSMCILRKAGRRPDLFCR